MVLKNNIIIKYFKKFETSLMALPMCNICGKAEVMHEGAIRCGDCDFFLGWLVLVSYVLYYYAKL